MHIIRDIEQLFKITGTVCIVDDADCPIVVLQASSHAWELHCHEQAHVAFMSKWWK